MPTQHDPDKRVRQVSAEVGLRRIGRENRPLVCLDDFAADPDALRAAAGGTTFGPAGHHYPGLRAALPARYLDEQMPIIARAARRICGRDGDVRVIDASFSVVTTSPAALSIEQRLPHCDAFGAERVALIHYLSPDAGAGTAFFRHRSTGFETIDDTRAPIYFDQLDAELRHGGLPPARYIAEDTPLFERIALAEPRYNRAYLYPSFLLHSGAIPADAVLSPDPLAGRLTVTAFLSVG